MKNQQTDFLRTLFTCVVLLQLATPLRGAELPTRRVDIHVDGERPIAGERSRFAVSPQGNIAFTYTLAAGDFACKPLGLISHDGEILMSAIDSESTWNVEGWATYGYPFDLTFDSKGELHVATRHRGTPYGVDYWHQVDGAWRLESFGAGVTFGGNTVALGVLPDGRPVVVCLHRNRTQLAIWERSADGQWTATRPAELSNVGSGQFDLAVHKSGVLRVLFCPPQGGPRCATRTADGNWNTQRIAAIDVSLMITATLDETDQLHVAFAAGESRRNVRELHYATLPDDNGTWQTRRVATSASERHVGLTDIDAAAGQVAIAWEHGAGPQFAPKDYGGTVGAVMLTVISNANAVTHELVTRDGGRPGLALSPDGKSAWVGVYTGNDQGDDFYVLNCRLDGGELAASRVVAGDAASIFRAGCLKEIDSGNEQAERRGLMRIDLSGVSAAQRQALISRYLNHDDPLIRQSIGRELASSPEAVTQFSDRLAMVLDDPDRLVRKTFLERLATGNADPSLVRPVFQKAISSDDAMTRLTAAEVVRQHPDWIQPEVLKQALAAFSRDLDSTNATVAGSAAMAYERMIELAGVRDRLEALCRTGSPLQRVRAALVLFRCGNQITLSFLADLPTQGNEHAQLALCGLLGQVRTSDCPPLLEECLQSDHPTVRAAAVFALRSAAHVAELRSVAKHPKGFDLLALRAAEPSSAASDEAQQAAVAVLIRALSHSDPNVRQKACDALNRVRAIEAAASIGELLDDSDAGVRIAARTAVNTLSDRPSTALIDHESWKMASSVRPLRRRGDVHRPPTRVVDGVVQVGADKQLLIDDLVIDEMPGLTRRLHSFEKHPRNPVFQAQLPWEEGWADPFMSTVIYDRDERCFKMWYRCGPRHSLKGYAVSVDGVDWQRPNVARSKWQEFEGHNLIGFEGQIATWKKPGNNVLFFPEARGADRFLSLFYQPPTSDYAISRSADGVAWQPPRSVRHAYGDVVSLIWDQGREQYLFFPKYNREHDGFVRRSFAATTLDKLDGPFSASFPFLAGHRDDARVADDASRAYGSLLPDTLRLPELHSEVYSVTAIPYEGVVVALYDLWAVTGTREGPLDMPMKVSREMKTWHDVDYPRRALTIGRFGEWDSGMVYGGNTMLVVDDQIRLYYLGANMGHCTRVLPTTKPYHTLGVGLATLRLDGFASLQTNEKPGEFTTKPLSIRRTNNVASRAAKAAENSENAKAAENAEDAALAEREATRQGRAMIGVQRSRLQINARCLRGGWIKAELLDSAGQPIPGFTSDDCDPFAGDSIRHTITWRGKADIPATPDPIRVRGVLSSAEIFAFQFIHPSDEP